MSTIKPAVSVVAETNDPLAPAQAESAVDNTASAKFVRESATHVFTSSEPVADILYPGLSPVFSTVHLSPFQEYIASLTDEATARAVPGAALQDGVLAIAISLAHVGEPGGGAVLSSDVAVRIAVTVPLFATSQGFSCFQIWLGPALVSHRKGLSPREFWRCRLIPFLSLPVLRVTSLRSPSTNDFRQQLESVAAALGRGITIASFPQTSRLPTFRFVPSDGRTDCLRSRFDALLFSVATSALANCAGACAAERALFSSAASAAFPSCASLLAITPAQNSTHGDVPPLWRTGVSAWLGTSSGPCQEFCLLDVITNIRLQPSCPSIAIRNLFVRTSAGHTIHWVVITRDSDQTSVALVAVIANDTVVCSAAAVLDSASDFLDLTADIDIALDNEPFLVAVDDILNDAGLFFDGDYLTDAQIVEDTDDILLAKLCSPSLKADQL